MSGIPKKIWVAWFQGWDAAPDLVKMNLTRWATLNPGWEVELLDQADTDALLADLDLEGSRVSPPARSDMLRVKLLTTYGGVWADATLYPCWSLDQWLPQVDSEDFFYFKNPGDPGVNPAWFLASSPGHPLAAGWWRAIAEYWSRPRVALGVLAPWLEEFGPRDIAPDSPIPFAPYFWLNALWRHCRASDPDFLAASDRVPAVSEMPVWTLANLRNRRQLDVAGIESAFRSTPVQKLDWQRGEYPLEVLATLGIAP